MFSTTAGLEECPVWGILESSVCPHDVQVLINVPSVLQDEGVSVDHEPKEWEWGDVSHPIINKDINTVEIIESKSDTYFFIC